MLERAGTAHSIEVVEKARVPIVKFIDSETRYACVHPHKARFCVSVCFVCMSVCLCVCLSVCLSVCLLSESLRVRVHV
jgi:hypothetical protein